MVAILKEDVLAPVATLRNVMRKPRNHGTSHPPRKRGDRRNVGTDGTFPATSRRMAPDLAPDTWGHTSVLVTDYFRRTPMRLAYETRRFASEEYQIARSSFQEPFQKQRLPGLFWHGAAYAAR